MVPLRRQREDTEHRQLRVHAYVLGKVVAVMPEAVKDQSRSQASRLTLNSDGQAHPVLNLLTAVTLAVGIAAFVCGLIVRAHFPATVLGIAGFGVGLWAQLNSATREERIFIITGVIAAFVGMALGIGHGGFS
jgi:FtsH-binding integral membrane protein